MYRDSRHYHIMAVGAYLPGVTCLVLLSTLSQLHNLNLRIKTEPVMAEADTTQYVRLLLVEKPNIYSHRCLCSNHDRLGC